MSNLFSPQKEKLKTSEKVLLEGINVWLDLLPVGKQLVPRAFRRFIRVSVFLVGMLLGIQGSL